MPNWRDKKKNAKPSRSKPEPRVQASVARGRSHWRGSGDRPARSSGVNAWLRRVVAICVAVGLIALLIQLLFPRDTTPLLVVNVGSFENPLMPPRPGATQENEIWKNLPKAMSWVNQPLTSLTALKSYLSGLPPVKAASKKSRTLVIFIAAQGVVGHAKDGDPSLFLLDQGSQPWDSDSWVEFGTLVVELQKKLGGEYGRVVLFLDSGAELTDWTMGLLHDDFSEQLEIFTTGPKSEFPDNWTLIHARGVSDPQRLADAGRRMKFASLLKLGLSGDAKQSTASAEITLGDMIKYLTDRLPKRIQVLRQSGNVSLVGRVPARQREDSKALTLELDGDHLRLLKGLWSDHENLLRQESKPWRQQPWVWARFEWALLRAERAWLAADRVENFTHWKDVAEELKAKIKIERPAEGELSQTPGNKPDAALEASPDAKNWPELPGERERISPDLALAHFLKRDVLDKEVLTTSELKPLWALRSAAEQTVTLDNDRHRAAARLERLTAASERQRRDLEDEAFLGQLKASFHQRIEGVRQAFGDAQSELHEYALALDQRDEFLARMPWLFRWVEADGDSRRYSEIGKLWNDGQNLFSVLGHADEPKDNSTIQSVKDLCGNATETVKGLVKEAQGLDEKWDSNRCEDVRKALAILSTPLVGGLTRGNLLEKLSELHAQLQSARDGLCNDQDAADRTARAPYFNADSHPLRVMLQLRAERSGEGGRGLSEIVDVDGSDDAALRRRIDDGRRISEIVAAMKSRMDWKERLEIDPDNVDTWRKQYAELSHADWRGRAMAVAATMADGPAVTTDDVVLRLDRYHDVEYCRWRGRRALDDFYGPLADGELKDSYFLNEADRWLSLPDGQKKESSSNQKGERKPLEELRREIAAWRKTSGRLLSLVPTPRSLDFGEEKAESPVEMELQIAASPADVPAPQGQLALDDPESLAKTTRPTKPVRLGRNIERDELWRETVIVPRLSRDSFSQTKSLSQAYFRGHRSEPAEVAVIGQTPEAPLQQKFSPPQTPDVPSTTITVKGQGAKPTVHVLLVLDCSFSMNDPNVKPGDVEAQGGNQGANRNLSRLEAAKHELIRMLDNLKGITEINLHVGLMCYGYRVGKNATTDELRFANHPRGKPSIIREPPLAGDVLTVKEDQRELDKLQPGEDVGRLVKIKEPFPASKNDLQDKLECLIPIGVTPLYLAIVKAIDEIGIAPNDHQKIILVITDGANNQEKFAPRTRLEDVTDKLKNPPKNLTIKVIGVGVDDKEWGQGTIKELKKVFPEQSKEENRNVDQPVQGSGKPVLRYVELKAAGKALLDELTFPIPVTEVQFLGKNADGQPETVTRELGDTYNSPWTGEDVVEVKVVRRERRSELTRDLDKKSIIVRGGENFELLFDEVGNKGRLRFHRFWEPLHDEAHPEIGLGIVAAMRSEVRRFTDREVAAISPKRENAAQVFRIAIRPKDSTAFPARPWLIRAMLFPKQNQTRFADAIPYIFEAEDSAFESRTQVPVLRLPAPDWPKDCDAAELKVWLEAAQPNGMPTAYPVRDFADEKETASFQKNQPAMTVQLKKASGGSNRDLTLIYQLPDEISLPTDAEKLKIVRISPPPLQVTRKYLKKKRRMEYQFTIAAEKFDRSELIVDSPPPAESALTWDRLAIDK